MATMQVYRVQCDMSPNGERCTARATFKVIAKNGDAAVFCGAHAKTALFDLTKAEGETKATPIESGKAVRV